MRRRQRRLLRVQQFDGRVVERRRRRGGHAGHRLQHGSQRRAAGRVAGEGLVIFDGEAVAHLAAGQGESGGGNDAQLAAGVPAVQAFQQARVVVAGQPGAGPGQIGRFQQQLAVDDRLDDRADRLFLGIDVGVVVQALVRQHRGQRPGILTGGPVGEHDLTAGAPTFDQRRAAGSEGGQLAQADAGEGPGHQRADGRVPGGPSQQQQRRPQRRRRDRSRQRRIIEQCHRRGGVGRREAGAAAQRFGQQRAGLFGVQARAWGRRFLGPVRVDGAHEQGWVARRKRRAAEDIDGVAGFGIPVPAFPPAPVPPAPDPAVPPAPMAPLEPPAFPALPPVALPPPRPAPPSIPGDEAGDPLPSQAAPSRQMVSDSPAR